MKLLRARPVGLVGLGVVLVATSLDIPVRHPSHAVERLVLTILAYAGLALLLLAHRARPFLTRRLVLGSVVALMVVAVAVPPRGSRDVWSYAMYGRIVSVHHESPYRVTPADVAPDPLLSRVSPRWREQPSVYGPAFVGAAAAITAATGSSALATRLAFQLFAALLVLAVLLLLWRSTRDPAALAWFGLNPLVAIWVVNAGHNDLLVGGAVLAAVLVAGRRPALAGAVVGLAALVKIVALLALLALGVDALRKRGMRSAVALVGAGTGLAVAGYLAVGSAGLVPLRAASRWHTPDSLASAILSVDPRIHAVALTELLVGAALLFQFRRRAVESWWLVGAVVTTYLLGAPYILPWYVAWVLPTAALAWRSRLSLLIVLQTAVLAVVSIDGRTIHPEALHDALSAAAHWLLPAMEVLALVALAVARWPRRAAETTAAVR